MSSIGYEDRVLGRLLQSSRNEIHRVYGSRRVAVDLAMAQQALRKTLAVRRERRLRRRRALRMIDCQLAFMRGVRNDKYVQYNGSIYLDCFAPKWPGRAFSRFIESVVRYSGADTEGFLQFIPSLVFSITKKCMYRCEHCYAIETRDIVEDDGLYRYLELARDIGVAFVQIIDATPSGNYLGKDVALTRKQMEAVRQFHITVNTEHRYRDYPTIQARAYLEDGNHFGCCGANALCYVDSSGNVQPCDLLQISFGNVLREDVDVIYARMKDWFPHPTRGRCPAQSLHREIAAVHDDVGALPLPHQRCESILRKIKNRGRAPYLAEVQDKRRKKPLHGR